MFAEPLVTGNSLRTMSHEWKQPPTPPSLPDATVAALADYCESMAQHLLRETTRVAEAGPDGLENLVAAVQANLSAARVLRESYDVDLWKYE